MRASHRYWILLLIAVLLAQPGRSTAVGFGVGGAGYDAGIGFQTPCCTILTDNLVTAATSVSAYMHATSQDQTAFTGFTMTSDLAGQMKIDGRSIGTSFANAGLYAGFPGLTLDDTLIPNGPAVGGSYLITPHLEVKGEIILDHNFDTTAPPPNGLMQLLFSVHGVAANGGTGGPCGGTGQAMTLSVDAPFDMILPSSACQIQQGGKLQYQVWLGEVGGGVLHGQITNAEVLGNTLTAYFDLPDGVTLSSASGAFQNVPEPSASVLVALGVLGLAARRPRARC